LKSVELQVVIASLVCRYGKAYIASEHGRVVVLLPLHGQLPLSQ
jgi:hypothetical protein